MKTKLSINRALKISEDVWLEGKKAESLLQMKCLKEKMSRTEVILKWGDPRKWK